MNNQILAHIALFLVALIYGANYTIAKEVLDDNYIQPLAFILLRVISGCVFFSAVHFFFIKEKVQKADIVRLIACGLFGVAINQMAFFSGLKMSTPIHAALIMTLTPILVLLTSAFIIKERITLLKIAGICIGILGATVLITKSTSIAFDFSQLFGDLLILINAISYGIYLVIVKTLMSKYHPITVLKWVFSVGLCFVIPFGFSDLMEINWGVFPTSIWLAVGYVLLFTTILTYLFNVFALSHVNPSVVSIYIYLQPLIASAISLGLGKERLDAITLFAALCIFSGVYLVSKKVSVKT